MLLLKGVLQVKKIILIGWLLLLGALLFSCAKAPEKEEAALYFPFLENTRFYYDGAGEGAIPYEVYNDYISDNKVQHRITDGNGGAAVVMEWKDGRLTRTTPVREKSFRENIMERRNLPAEVILQSPVEEGNSWELRDGRIRTIGKTGISMETPAGSFEVMEVVTEGPGKKTLDYYGKDWGLVKSIVREGNQEISYTLSRIETEASRIEPILFYYPDFNEKKIYTRSRDVTFQTNDTNEAVMTRALGDVLGISKEAEIKGILPPKKGEGTLRVDWNRPFSAGMDLRSVDEGLLLQSLVNTLCHLYDSSQMVLTVEGGKYKTDHLNIETWQTLPVRFDDYVTYYDVLVYGGTASGVMAAIAAAQEGADVAILEPGRHLGGMVSSGLGYTDRRNTEKIGGLAKAFLQKVGSRYNREISWDFEPHAAEETLLQMAAEAGIDVYYEKWLPAGGVEGNRAKITGIRTGDDSSYAAQIFIDCSYEGDLMAYSGVSYTLGRESVSQYGESLAGIRPGFMGNNFIYPMKAETSSGAVYPEVSPEPVGQRGSGDERIQAYTYRLCLSNDPANQIPFSKPLFYDPARYELLLHWLEVLKSNEGGRALTLSDLMFFGRLPNNKVDVNNSGPFSTDYIGGSLDYAEGDLRTRREIEGAHRNYLEGLFYFLWKDESVPTELREEIGRWGYARDEFVDNGNWPYQIYLREGRRMTGEFVMTQQDLQTNRAKEDSIGMGTYNIDSHHVQRFITADGYIQNEGDIQVRVSPYQIPYRIMVPKREEAENLLVPVCMSASHVAYGSLRMELQYMILGEAAGTAAVQSFSEDVTVQDVSVPILQIRLEEKGAVLE